MTLQLCGTKVIPNFGTPFFFLICDIFIEICAFLSWIHEVSVPYPGLVNISKAHIYKDVSIC
jgi:hypothetical protein